MSHGDLESGARVELVQHAMRSGVVSCSPDTTLREAAKLMTDASVRALVVVEGDCGLAGIVSQTDLVNATLVHPHVRYWGGLRVKDVMTEQVCVVTPDTPLQEAARLMIERRIHRVVVVQSADDPCHPVGVLSMGDIVRDLAEDEDA